jgi:DNA (cytosine-5)-methyltransferase 1
VNYYNEFDPVAAEWLRQLIANDEIPPGDVDERSIADVQPGDLAGYSQCHFFAGIGGWSLALRMAGIPDDVKGIWSGSCPCQPFSTAGRRRGTDDERHLWPVFAGLIRECSPPVVIGEQVASSAGRAWLSVVLADLEGMGYGVAGADLCAAGVGAPHIRPRIYWGGVRPDDAPAWVADAARDDVLEERGEGAQAQGEDHGQPQERERHEPQPQHRSDAGPWGAIRYVRCSDNRERPVPLQPALFPVVDGVPSAEVASVRGSGNAIVPQVAAAFVQSLCEAVGDL